jgi:hypothetical protein
MSSSDAQRAFARAVRAREPLVIRSGCASWPLARTWTRAHLAAAEATPTFVDVNVVSDRGLSGAAGEQAVERLEFSHLMRAGALDALPAGTALYLAQCELDLELPQLAREVPARPGFGGRVLSRAQLTRHLWLNRGRVTSRMHYDGYHNVLCCVRGRKTLMLLPPRAAAAGRIVPAAACGLSPNHLAQAPVNVGLSRARGLRARESARAPRRARAREGAESDRVVLEAGRNFPPGGMVARG